MRPLSSLSSSDTEQSRLNGKVTSSARLDAHPLPAEAGGVAIGGSEFIPGEVGVIACRPFEPGELLYTVRGPISERRTLYSFQCGPNEHIDPLEETGEFGFGHYTNHSCNPNAYIAVVEFGDERFIEVRARKAIPAGCEIALDYAAMEYVIAHGVECLCGRPECRGKLLGFRDLPVEIKLRYRHEGIVPNYLFELDGHESPPHGAV
jgi:hypothetical protein